MLTKEREPVRTGDSEALQSEKTIYIDKAGKQIKIGDRIISFENHNVLWGVFLFLALNSQNSQDFVPAKAVKEIERKSGSKIKSTAVTSISPLKKVMGDPKIISMIGTSGGKNTAYRLDANIVDAKEGDGTFPPEELKFPLDGLQLKAAYVFFVLNKGGTDYKSPSTARLRARLFNNQFKNEHPPEWKEEIMRIRFGRDFQRERNNFRSWIKKLMSEPLVPSEKLSPETRKWMEWLNSRQFPNSSIPIYKGLSAEDLVSIVKRETSFKELMKLKAQKKGPQPLG